MKKAFAVITLMFCGLFFASDDSAQCLGNVYVTSITWETTDSIHGYSSTELDYCAGTYYDPALWASFTENQGAGYALIGESYSEGIADWIPAEIYFDYANPVNGLSYTTNGSHYIIAYYQVYVLELGGYYWYDPFQFGFSDGFSNPFVLEDYYGSYTYVSYWESVPIYVGSTWVTWTFQGQTQCPPGTPFTPTGVPCTSEPTPTPQPIPTPTPTPTPNVTSVTFSLKVPSTSPIDRNPEVLPHNPGFGRRIFPDDDIPQDTVDRRIVRVTATLSQPISGVQVYFRNFDVDDPSFDPIIDPNGIDGDDNNGTPMAGTLSMCTATPDGCWASTDANGAAVVEFTVTRQPGDNFAIAASVIPSEVGQTHLSGIALIDARNQIVQENCPTDLVCRSEMLTVWRRLHIEVDSMGLSTQNFVVGNIEVGARIRRFESATLTVNTATHLEVNRFEGGRMTVGSNSLAVLSNTAGSVTVRYSGFSSVILIPTSAQFVLYDDDDFNDNNGTALNGDTGEDIPAPDDPSVNGTALLQPNDILCNQTITSGCNAFASVYVRPMYDITGNVNGDVKDNNIFQANIEVDDSLGSLLSVDFDQKLTENSVDFWTIVLYGAYQGPGPSDPIYNLPPGGLDGDPPDSDGNGNPPFGCPEVTYGEAQSGLGSLGVALYMEVLRPREYPGNYALYPLSPARTAAHEIGHMFGGIHADGGLMEVSCGASLDTGYVFDSRTIRRLRNSVLNP